MKENDDDRTLDELPDEDHDPWWFMPSPQVAAVAVMALLTAGVVIGSVTSPVARSYGVAPIVVEELGGSEPEPEAAMEAEPVRAEPSPAPEATAYAATAEAPLPAAPEAPTSAGEAPPPLELPPELEEEEQLPEIKHVFLVALDGHDYAEAFGPESQLPYLSQTLAGEGKLLAEYRPLAEGGLAERIAPLGERMTAAKLSWREYVEPPLGEEAQPAGEEEEEETRGDFDRLAADLKEAATTPAFSYVVPGEQLETIVSEIESSPAFEEEAGLLAVTFDHGPEEAVPAAEPPPVGMLLISPYVAPGTVDETGRYDHLSFLATVEELLGLEPPRYRAEDGAEPPPVGFPPTIFDASPEESTVAPAPAQRKRSGMKR